MIKIILKILIIYFIFIGNYQKSLAEDIKENHEKKAVKDLEKNIENEILTLEKVIKSAVKNYPKILSYYENIKSLESDLLASKGFFDIRLKQNFYDRTKGYYDGKIYNAEIEKNLGILGGKVYSGYRKSYGKFAEYDGDNLTNNRGEYRAGAKFSLLKDRDIDKNRLEIMLKNLGVEEGKIELENIKMEICRDASKAYWQWFSSGKILQIYENLYQLSLNRQKQLQAKVKQGDIAQIILIENRKNLLKRKTSLLKIRQEFEVNSLYLSLFYRNDNQETLKISIKNLPKNIIKISSIPDDKKIKNNIEQALIRRPEIKLIKLKNKEQTNQLKYGKNLLQPQLDVEIGASKDQGNGSLNRSQTNNFANVTMSLPLQFSEARGKINSAEAKLSSIKYQTALLEDQIKVEIDQLIIKILTINEAFYLMEEEVKLAQTLQDSELEKFKQGASNFFLVNLREQENASTQASLFEVYKELQNSLVDYKLAIFDNEEINKIQ